MPNRGYATHGKTSRRLRLWLKPETWALLDRLDSERAWHTADNTIVERILDDYAAHSLSARLAHSSDRSTGPVPSPQLAQSS